MFQRTCETTRRTSNVAILALVLIAITVALPGCTLTIQPVESYESLDGLYALDYPAQWDIVNESLESDLASVVIGSFPELIEMDSIPSGEAGMGIMLLPDVVPVTRGESRQMSAEEFGAMVQAEATRAEEYVSPVEEVAIDGMTDVYRFKATSPGGARAAYFFAPDDGLIAVYVLIYASDDDDTEVSQMVEDSISSFRIVGDADEYIQKSQAPQVVKP